VAATVDEHSRKWLGEASTRTFQQEKHSW